MIRCHRSHTEIWIVFFLILTTVHVLTYACNYSNKCNNMRTVDISPVTCLYKSIGNCCLTG